jgi:hypothetical protein
MTRRVVSSDRAPEALGPYSQAIVAGGFVFVTVSKTAASGSTPGSPVVEEPCGKDCSPSALNVALGAEARALTIHNGSAQARSHWDSHARSLALPCRRGECRPGDARSRPIRTRPRAA